MKDKKCPWRCGHIYPFLDYENERQHLMVCPVYRSLPVAVIRDGKEYVRSLNGDNIFVQREPLVN